MALILAVLKITIQDI